MGGRRRNKVGLLLIITSVAIAISKIGVQLHLTRRLQTSPLSGDNLLETLESLLHAYHRRARSEIPEFHCGVQLESIRLDQITYDQNLKKLSPSEFKMCYYLLIRRSRRRMCTVAPAHTIFVNTTKYSRPLLLLLTCLLTAMLMLFPRIQHESSPGFEFASNMTQ